MELASVAFGQIMTMVILMVVGAVCAKIGMIDEGTNKKLSNLLLLLVNPLVIFLSFQRPFEEELLNGLLLTLLLSLVSFIIAIAVAHIIYTNRKGKDYAVEKFGAVYTNAGFLGIPLVNGVFGSEGVFYLTGYLMVFFLFFWTHGLIVMSGKRDFSTIKKAVLSPPMLSIFLGFALFMLRIEIPQVIYTPLVTLGNINTPLAMLIAGVSISGASIMQIVKNKRVFGLCVVRLILLPALTILVFGLFDIPPIVLGTVVMVVSCPIAANLIMFAYRYDRDYVYSSQVFAATTILSLVTIPLVLLWL